MYFQSVAAPFTLLVTVMWALSELEKEPRCVWRATWITEYFLIVARKHNRKGQVGHTRPFILSKDHMELRRCCFIVDWHKKKLKSPDDPDALWRRNATRARRRQFAWLWRARMGFMRLSLANKTFFRAFSIWRVTDRFIALWKNNCVWLNSSRASSQRDTRKLRANMPPPGSSCLAAWLTIWPIDSSQLFSTGMKSLHGAGVITMPFQFGQW